MLNHEFLPNIYFKIQENFTNKYGCRFRKSIYEENKRYGHKTKETAFLMQMHTTFKKQFVIAE